VGGGGVGFFWVGGGGGWGCGGVGFPRFVPPPLPLWPPEGRSTPPMPGGRHASTPGNGVKRLLPAGPVPKWTGEWDLLARGGWPTASVQRFLSPFFFVVLGRRKPFSELRFCPALGGKPRHPIFSSKKKTFDLLPGAVASTLPDSAASTLKDADETTPVATGSCICSRPTFFSPPLRLFDNHDSDPLLHNARHLRGTPRQ